MTTTESNSAYVVAVQDDDCGLACTECGCHDRFDQLMAVTRRWERLVWWMAALAVVGITEAALYATKVWSV